MLLQLVGEVAALRSNLFQEAHDYWLAAIASIFAGLTAWLARLAVQKKVERDSEARFRMLAEAIPEIVWTAVPEVGIDYYNRRWAEVTGLSPEQTLGWGWKQAIHPDDLPLTMERWMMARRTGECVQAEYRLRTASGAYRWFLIRATPMLDETGNVVRWFGSSVDIDAQRQSQQLLQEQIAQHTEELRDANMRLENEMRERALAQQEFNQQSEAMVRELTRRFDRATAVAKCAELLQSAGDLDELLVIIQKMGPQIFPEVRGAVLLYGASRDVLQLVTSWSDCRLSGTVFSPQDCWALRIGHTHHVTSADRTVECRHVPPGEVCYCCLPLMTQQEPIGILHVQAEDDRAAKSESLMLMVNMFAKQVALSITNLRLREALRNQSIRDPLTGVFNRRYMEETLEREIRRAQRFEQSLGILMLDLDHFKLFNDAYGHEAGDAILRELAALLVRSVRAEDVVCRFGGEEFVIILPAANLEITAERAESIRQRLHQLAVMHQGHVLNAITASFGVAAFPDNGRTASGLLESADAAMYRAKREGRDRVLKVELLRASTALAGS